jgi:adenine deaminase
VKRERDNLEELIDVALGDRPLDLVVRGARVVNIFTGETSEQPIGVALGRIVAVGELPEGAVGPNTKQIDFGGRFALPGFVDPHFHIGGSQLAIPELARALVPHGTTTIVSDLQEIYTYSGLPGVRFILDQARGTPLRVLFVPSAHVLGLEDRGHYAHAVSADEMVEMLDWPETVGINEPPPVMVLGKNPGTLQVVKAALERGLLFPGHLPGVSGTPLQAYAVAGASSCHESQTDSEAVEKLRLGLWAMMREGSAAVDLERVAPLLHELPRAARWSMVCSDEQDAPELAEKGNVDEKLRILRRNGVDPIDAIQMGTINPALYYRMDDEVGSIAPGRSADIIAVTDLDSFEVTDVISRGVVQVADGAYLASTEQGQYPDFLRSKVRWSREIGPDDFEVTAQGERARVRVIGVHDGSLVSDKREATLDVVAGKVQADPDADVLKIAVIDRHTEEVALSTGFIQGFGIKDGAVASTYCHVHYNVVVIGTSDEQMALACNELAKVGGGVVVISGSQPLKTWPLPLVGIFSTEPFEQARADLGDTNGALQHIGCAFSSPILGLSFVALTTIPEYGITEKGLFDVDSRSFLPVVVTD